MKGARKETRQSRAEVPRPSRLAPVAGPAISVLLPVRDGGEPLSEAIASLATQTYENFEVIAVDDGSKDDTPRVLEAWADQDPRVTVLRQEPLGIVPALEAARAQARAPYHARMDADDVSLPTRLAEQLALMRGAPELVACGSLVEYFPRDRVRDGALRYETWINRAVRPEEIARAIFVECPLAHPTLFVRAEAVDRVGGYVDRGWPEDYDLVLRLWGAGGPMAKVPRVLVRWREGPDRLSRTDARYSPGAFLSCKVHYLVRSLLRTRPAVIWGAGPVGKSLSRSLRARGAHVEAFVELDARKIGQEIHGAPVLDTEAGLARRGPVHLAAVGQEGVRAKLTALLSGAGFRELEDFVAVA